MAVALDTGVLVAAGNRRDRWHASVREFFQTTRETLLLPGSVLMTRYENLKLDFVDASIIALAERLGITRIATTDRRDFSLVRPSHCERFELLP